MNSVLRSLSQVLSILGARVVRYGLMGTVVMTATFAVLVASSASPQQVGAVCSTCPPTSGSGFTVIPAQDTLFHITGASAGSGKCRWFDHGYPLGITCEPGIEHCWIEISGYFATVDPFGPVSATVTVSVDAGCGGSNTSTYRHYTGGTIEGDVQCEEC